jgi:hypothetical protein
MLQKNPLCPPVPCQPSRGSASQSRFETASERFVSAEDFDATGVLSGVDPCESRYWWMPELYGPDGAAESARSPLAELLARGPRQATSRSTPRPTAAA